MSYLPFDLNTKNAILTLLNDKPDAKYRIGILAINGKITSNPEKIKGTYNSRHLFFNDANTNDDF